MSEVETQEGADEGAPAAEEKETKPVFGILAEYDSPGSLIAAAEKVRDAGFTNWDCFSPFPVHGIDPAMGIKRTKLPWVVFIGGVTGLIAGVGLQYWTNVFDWAWISSGKPFFSLPANIPIIFELTVLLSGFAAFFGLWVSCKLPRLSHPYFSVESFAKVTDNGFFIGVEADDPEYDEEKTAELLTGAGATNLETAYRETDPKKTQMPKFILPAVAITTIFALLPFVYISKVRASYSEKPHFHVIPDMDFQYKTKSQVKSDFFADNRGSRGTVPGTVYVGKLTQGAETMMDEAAYNHYYYGLTDTEVRTVAPTDTGEEAPEAPEATDDATDNATGDDSAVEDAPVPPAPVIVTTKRGFATTFPASIPLNTKTMGRGQERFNIYCAPCHGNAGYGNGLVNRRIQISKNDNIDSNDSPAWSQPADLTDGAVVTQPAGQLFYSMSFGKGEMAGYAAQITEKDRWAITFYLRALQRRANASTSDVPPSTKLLPAQSND